MNQPEQPISVEAARAAVVLYVDRGAPLPSLGRYLDTFEAAIRESLQQPQRDDPREQPCPECLMYAWEGETAPYICGFCRIEAAHQTLVAAAAAVLASRAEFTLENGSGFEETGWDYDEDAIEALRRVLALPEQENAIPVEDGE